jgi:GntR family transcriptional regulator
VSDIQRLIHRVSERVRNAGGNPVSQVIVDEVWLAVVEGDLPIGERLPTTRELAVRLGVSPRTVEHAYEELASRGVVAARPGQGTFISLTPPPDEERERHRRFADLCRETFDRAQELGFTVDDLIDALAEYRSAGRSGPEEV